MSLLLLFQGAGGAPAEAPFKRENWPTPPTRRFCAWLSVGVAANLLLSTLTPVPPVRSSDPSLPRVAARALSLSTHLQATDLNNLRPDVSPLRPDSWPLPGAKAGKAESLTGNLLQTTLDVVQSPFTPSDWSLPGKPVRIALSHTVATDLGNLRPDVAPFIPRQWPLVPAAARALSLSTHLTPTDLGNLRPDVAAFRQTDWPLAPKSAPRALALSAHLESTDLGNLRPDVNPFLTPEQPVPAKAKPAGVSHLVSTDLNILRPDVAPLRPDLWPLPRAKGTAGLSAHLEQTDLLTLRPDVKPFRTPDLNLPAKPRPAGVSHLASTDLNVQRPEVAPFNQNDWQTPRNGAKLVSRDHSQNLLQTTLQIVLQDPFKPNLWPLPQKPARATASHTVSTDLNTLRPDVAPLRPDLWTLPKATARQTENLAGNLLQTTLNIVVQAPFAQFDWVLPQRAARSASLLTHLEPTDLGNLRPDVNPFVTPDLDLPAKPRSSGVSHIVSTDLNVLRPDVAPFNQDDWQSFKAGVRAVPDTPQSGLLQTTLQISVPFVPEPWPLPQTRARSVLSHLVSTDLGNLRPDVRPFDQTDWPLPLTPERAWSLNAHLEPTDLLVLRPDVLAFNQDDWPLPLKPARAWSLNTHAYFTLPILGGAGFSDVFVPSVPCPGGRRHTGTAGLRDEQGTAECRMSTDAADSRDEDGTAAPRKSSGTASTRS